MLEPIDYKSAGVDLDTCGETMAQGSENGVKGRGAKMVSGAEIKF